MQTLDKGQTMTDIDDGDSEREEIDNSSWDIDDIDSRKDDTSMDQDSDWNEPNDWVEPDDFGDNR